MCCRLIREASPQIFPHANARKRANGEEGLDMRAGDILTLLVKLCSRDFHTI
jgi:hypothetical protein